MPMQCEKPESTEYEDSTGKSGPCVHCKRNVDGHDEDWNCLPPPPKGRKRRAAIIELARQYHEEGDLELDANAKISEGDDNGAYVQMWKWVPFDGTALSKEAP